MKLTLQFEVEVDERGIAEYKALYPDFEAESTGELLIREAIANWDIEGLLVASGATEARVLPS